MSDKPTITAQDLMSALQTVIAASPADVIAAISKPGDTRPITQRIAELPDHLKFSIASIKFDKFGPIITMVPKATAIELAGKALAMWTDRTVLTTVPVEEIPLIENGASLEDAAEIYAATLRSIGKAA